MCGYMEKMENMKKYEETNKGKYNKEDTKEIIWSKEAIQKKEKKQHF